MSDKTKVCGCFDCNLPPCDGCNDDHGGINMGDRRLCRDCFMEVMAARMVKNNKDETSYN